MPPAPAFLQFSTPTFSAGEGTNTATITVIRTGNTGGAASVRYSVSDGTARDFYDYASATGVVSFASASTQATFTVGIKNDVTPEGTETIELRLFEPTGGPSLGNPATAALNILDDDPVQPGTISFVQPAYSVAEASRFARLWVARTGGSNGVVTAEFATSDGSAIAGSDYLSQSGTLTFSDGEIAKMLVIEVLEDSPIEGPKAFTVTLSNPGGGATVGDPLSTRVTIIDQREVVAHCDETALRAAVAAGGTVVLACSGTIVLSTPLIVSNGTVIDAANYTATLSGGNTSRIFNISPGASLDLIHLTLVDGLARGIDGMAGQPGGNAEGGAIYNNGGTLRASGCAFLHNKAHGGSGGPATSGTTLPGTGGAGRGGAIYNHGGQTMLADCVLTENEATGGSGGTGNPISLGGESNGGAIYSDGGNVGLIGCRLQNNISVSGLGTRPGGAASGGAIDFIAGTTELTGCVLAGNASLGRVGASAHGGAAGQQGGSLSIQDSLLVSNYGEGGFATSARFGGGRAFGGALSILAGNAILSGSTLASNYAQAGGGFTSGAGLGGGVFNAADLDIRNCTRGIQLIGYGPSEAFGGGLYQSTGAVRLVHTTLARNATRVKSGSGSVQQGGTIFSSTNGRVTLSNSIVALSPAGSNSFGVLVDGGHNLSSDGSCSFKAPGSLNNTEPNLGPLADYTGPTPTMALLPGSPAIDGAGSAACVATDQRGRARPVGAACDIGAFESGAPYTVLGQLSGYVPPTGSARVGNGSSTAQIDVFGQYALHGLAPGTHTVKPESELVVFVPKTREVSVIGDTVGIDFTSYRTNAIAAARVAPGAITATFAGEAGVTYDVQVTPGLVPLWNPYSVLTADADGLIRWSETNASPGLGRFFRVKRP